MQRVRILLLTHSFWPDISPPQRRWGVFTREFASAGHQIDVVAPKVFDQNLLRISQRLAPPEGVTVYRYPSIRKPGTMLGKLLKHAIDALRSIPTALRTPRPQIVIATVPAIPTLAVGYLVSRMRRTPFVVDLRDAWPDLLQDSQVLRLAWLEPLVSRMLTFMIHRSDLVVTVSEGFAQKLMSEGARKAITISNGVDIDRYGMDLLTTQRGEKLRVLYLGNLGRSQGLDLVIRAAALAKSNVQLRIVGQGTEITNLRQLAAGLDVDVDFKDPVYGPSVLDNYAWADTCLVTLRSDWDSFEHTIPSKLYELLFLDCHITGLVKGEAAEIIRASRSGQVIEQSDRALAEHFLNLYAERRLLRTGHAGSKWVRRNAALPTLGQQYLRELKWLTDRYQESK
ncbi:glycosyltransferase family 4 protein [Arthrobacter sp. JCM 19049]|uniref:glycosyltransferase family 4 protein n=1 Tax=Arthrobacter sp. JCM 19049 TaxID=1460643 RepID=UPI0006CFB2B9|nr:glycosyltransferase family 4 protein [Arthrobacter sp. JCM 19049]